MNLEVEAQRIYRRFFINLNFIGLVKPLYIMARVDLKFLDCLNDKDHIKVEHQNTIKGGRIVITGEVDLEPFEMYLDKSTAIRFAKTVRTEINKIQD